MWLLEAVGDGSSQGYLVVTSERMPSPGVVNWG
jgi:hypothetical protein